MTFKQLHRLLLDSHDRPNVLAQEFIAQLSLYFANVADVLPVVGTAEVTVVVVVDDVDVIFDRTILFLTTVESVEGLKDLLKKEHT